MNLQMTGSRFCLLVVVALAATVAAACARAIPEPTPTPTAVPTPTPTPTPEPTPTPTATPAAEWADELYEFEDPDTGETYLMAPDEVIAMVQEQYLEGLNWANMPPIFDIEELRRDASLYYSGSLLEMNLEMFDAMARGEELEWSCPEMEHELKVRNFREDGLGCIVEDVSPSTQCQGYDINSQEVEEEMEVPSLMVTTYMVYDLEDGRWKQDTMMDVVALEAGP